MSNVSHESLLLDHLNREAGCRCIQNFRAKAMLEIERAFAKFVIAFHRGFLSREFVFGVSIVALLSE